MAIKVEIFVSQGCDRCAHARKELQQLVESLGDDRLEWRAIAVLDEIDYAVKLGVLSTPAIAIDGILVFASLPTKKALRRAIHERVAKSSGCS